MPLKPNLSISKAAVDKLKVRWRGVSFQMCVFFYIVKLKKRNKKITFLLLIGKGHECLKNCKCFSSVRCTWSKTRFSKYDWLCHLLSRLTRYC